MLLGRRTYEYSDDDRHWTLRHTAMMLTPTLDEPRKFTVYSHHVVVVVVIASLGRHFAPPWPHRTAWAVSGGWQSRSPVL